MAESVVLGLINGLTVGLLAVGLVLVHKANRFVDLAVLLAMVVIDRCRSWWLAFPVAVLVGTGSGSLVERLVVRPLGRGRRDGIELDVGSDR